MEQKRPGRPAKKIELPQEPTPEEVKIPVVEEEIVESIPSEIKVEQPKVEQPKYTTERTVENGSIAAKKMPSLNSGVCEHCGNGRYDTHASPMRMIEDWTVDPKTQTGRCEHYKGVKIRCSYCPFTANWEDNIRHRKHNVFESPWNPSELIVICGDMKCQDKHLKRAMGGKF